MSAVNYRLHFSLLVFAAVALTIWFEPIHAAIPIDRFHAHFALVGALHATAWVLALRTQRELVERIAFVALVAALSVGSVYGGLASGALIPERGDIDGRFVASTAIASAAGASAYWFAIRGFWLPRLGLNSLALTVCFCVVATLLAFVPPGMAAAPRPPEGMEGVDFLTFFWWAAFSSSMFLAERGWLPGKWGRRSVNTNDVAPSPEYVLSVGDCPVTPGAELVFVLIARASGRPVFWCPLCGCAWSAVPPAFLNEIKGLADVAPSGVRLATEEDVAGADFGDRELFRVPYSEWRDFLDDVVGPSRTQPEPRRGEID